MWVDGVVWLRKRSEAVGEEGEGVYEPPVAEEAAMKLPSAVEAGDAAGGAGGGQPGAGVTNGTVFLGSGSGAGQGLPGPEAADAGSGLTPTPTPTTFPPVSPPDANNTPTEQPLLPLETHLTGEGPSQFEYFNLVLLGFLLAVLFTCVALFTTRVITRGALAVHVCTLFGSLVALVHICIAIATYTDRTLYCRSLFIYFFDASLYGLSIASALLSLVVYGLRRKRFNPVQLLMMPVLLWWLATFVTWISIARVGQLANGRCDVVLPTAVFANLLAALFFGNLIAFLSFIPPLISTRRKKYKQRTFLTGISLLVTVGIEIYLIVNRGEGEGIFFFIDETFMWACIALITLLKKRVTSDDDEDAPDSSDPSITAPDEDGDDDVAEEAAEEAEKSASSSSSDGSVCQLCKADAKWYALREKLRCAQCGRMRPGT